MRRSVRRREVSWSPRGARRLTFIRRIREIGFSIDAVRGLLALVDGNDFSCEEGRALTLAHLRSVRREVERLRRLERALTDMAARCSGGHVPQCPIVDALFDAGQAPSRA